jgi:2'-5' RNA ligase
VSGARPPRPKRLFVACDLPGDVLEALKAWQVAALAPQPDVRAVGSLHITLAFLGDVPAASVDDVVAALRPLTFTPFKLRLEAPVFLPERGRRNVVALHLADPSGGLASLQARASEALRGTGLYKPSRRPWLAHVTVARFRRPGHPFPLQNVTIPQFGVDRMVLYSSLLEKAGAVHTPVAEFPAS